MIGDSVGRMGEGKSAGEYVLTEEAMGEVGGMGIMVSVLAWDSAAGGCCTTG